MSEETEQLKRTSRTLAAQSQEKEREIISLDEQIFKLETELDRLLGLLRRWQTFSNNLWISDFKEEREYISLEADTTEALK